MCYLVITPPQSSRRPACSLPTYPPTHLPTYHLPPTCLPTVPAYSLSHFHVLTYRYLPAYSRSYFHVTQATAAIDAYELQLVAAQDEMVAPKRWFEARLLPDLEPS